jgi:hypothetical protein
MLGTYCDDSGSDAGNANLVVAGFSSSVDQWARFDGEWETVLAQNDIPCFHAKEFDDGRRGRGRYAAWGETRRRDFMGQLLGIIVRRTFKSFGVLVNKGAYAATIGGIPKAKRYFGAPYSFAGFSCIHMACHWRDVQYENVPLLFTFDSGHANEGELKRAADAIKKSDRMIIDLATGDDRKLPPLQAADLIAYELFAEARRKDQSKRRYSRYPLVRLDEHPNEWLILNQNNLPRMLEDFRPFWDR